jgi:hypothetical protein
MERRNGSPALWWLPIARRMLGWGVTMACLWGWFPFLFGGEVGLYVLLSPDGFKESDGGSIGTALIFLTLLIPLFIMCAWMLGGMITGALAGFYALPSEPKNPLKSHFFRTVGRQTFWFWIGASLIITVSLTVLNYAFRFYLTSYVFTSALVWLQLISQIGVFILSVCRALNRAISEQSKLRQQS